MPHAVIFGAGSIGCFHGLSWLSEGIDLSFLGREATRGPLMKNGGGVSGPFGQRQVPAERINFHCTPDILSEADIIFLTVKATGNETAAREILAHARPGTMIVSLQNGIGNAQSLKSQLPDFEIVEGMTPFNVIKAGPAHWKKTMKGQLILSEDERLRTFFKPLDDGPFVIRFHRDMRAVLWSKLLLNLNNALNALSGQTLHAQLSNRGWRRLLAAAQKEALTAAAAEGIELVRLTPLPPQHLPGFIRMPNWFFNTIGLRLQGIARDARSSMSDDFDAGRKTEVDFLNGAIVDAAARHGIASPVNAAIVRCVHEAENGGRKTWTAEDLIQTLDQAGHAA